MIWEESKHPRDDRGRFTDGKSLAKEVAPNENAEKLKNESIESLKQKLKMEGASNNTVTQNFAQEKLPEHNPDYNYVHQPGKIAGAEKGNPMTFKQADSGNVNPYYNKGFIGYERNCQTCVAVFLARLHGYDVQALPNFNNKSITKLSYNTSLAYIDANGNHPGYDKQLPAENRIDFLERIVKKDEIRTLEFNKIGSGGHIVIVERNKTGELQFYDPQINEFITKNEFPQYLYLTISLKSMNLTNCTIDEKFADKIMKKRS